VVLALVPDPTAGWGEMRTVWEEVAGAGTGTLTGPQAHVLAVVQALKEPMSKKYVLGLCDHAKLTTGKSASAPRQALDRAVEFLHKEGLITVDGDLLCA
jgi:hypothetical protein